jgi:neutral ceramidase
MSAPLRAAGARAVITPPLGVSLAGSYTDRRATRVHQDLYARAFVLEQGGEARGGEARGGEMIALVSCDLIGVRASTVAGARRLIEQVAGIPPQRVLVHGTHNHSGPLTRELGASGLAGENDEPYLAMLERQIAGAVQQALSGLQPCRLRLTLSQAPGIAFNRRFVMAEGPVRTNPGKGNPAIVEPAGPLDERVWTLCALPSLPDGVPDGAPSAVPPATSPLAVLVNFALHPAIAGGTEICGDFPAALEESLQALLGGPFTVTFANAPCGDINHIDVSHGHRQSGIVEARRVGTVLGAAAGASACRLVADWEPHDGRTTLRGASTTVDLPLRRPTEAEFARARQVIASGTRMTMAPGAGLEVVQAHRVVALADHWTGTHHRTEVQALALGDELAIVGLPGEVFAELGLDLRARSPFPHTLVLGLANEAIGYVPTRRAYEEGGYEPTSSRLQPGGGERLVEAALDLLTRLHER